MKLTYSSAAEGETYSIAIVDGDQLSRDTAAFVLGSEEASIKVYSSAENFLQDLSQSALSCVVIDANLPGMSGLELQRYLAAVGVRVPVVMYSANNDVTTAMNALRQGAVDFVTKPLDGALLRRVVCEATQRDASHSPHRNAA